jgi:hypothetical protein
MTRPVLTVPERWLWLVLWLLVIAIGVWLRLWQIGHQILIDDEWHAIHRLMHAGYRDIFLSFGHADYTIPLTLLFKLLAETIGLGEWRLRALPLAFGMATVVVVPWVMRPWLARNEQWLFCALLAISPLLIHFTRYVRPYALTVPLGFVAMVALWRWWHERRRAWAVVFVIAATVCAWLHPLTLLFTGSALLWFGLAALDQWRRGLGTSALWRIVPLGLLTTFLCSALVLPPLLADPDAMSSKSGIHQIQWLTFVRAWELIAGTAAWLPAVVMLALTGAGALRLFRRDHWFVGYWAFMSVVAVIVISLLDAAWIHHALVLVRYSAVFQPLILLLVALGLVGVINRASAIVNLPGAHLVTSAVLMPTLLLLLYFSGPLPRVYTGINQSTSHMRYHFDYDFERSVYTRVMAEAELPEFYRRIADEPGDWVLIETPWHFESHFSPLSEYQRHHQMPMRIGMITGLCVDWTHGELRRDTDQHIVFRHFVFVADLLDRPPTENSFVIFHRGTPFGYVRELPDVEPCIQAYRDRLGEPWYEDQDHVVFQLRSG